MISVQIGWGILWVLERLHYHVPPGVCETWNEHVRDGQLRPQVQDRRDYRRAIRHAAHLLQGLVFRNIIGVTIAGIVTHGRPWKTVDNTSLVTLRAWLRA